MWLELGRRISVVMLIVAFASGSAVPAVQAHSHHMVTVAMAADNQGNCTHEHDQYPPAHQADMHGMCCASSASVGIVLPASIGLQFADGQDTFTPSLDRAMTDHTVPPDPHPPKQVELI